MKKVSDFEDGMKLIEKSYIRYNYIENMEFFREITANINSYNDLMNSYPISINDKILIVVDGAIGSGKSTYLHNFIEFFDIKNMPIISPDIYLKKFYPDMEYLSAYNKTKENMNFIMEYLLQKKNSFILETVLAKKDKIDFLKKCKFQGYKVIGIYIGTDSHIINNERILNRIEQGAFTIPQTKIENRHKECLNYLLSFYEISDSIFAYDNSKSNLLLVLF